MAKWRFQARGTSVTGLGVTDRLHLLGGSATRSTIEANAQIKFLVAYTVSLMRLNITNQNGTATAAFRDDGVDSTNLTLSITGTGWQEDATGSDTPAADSLCNLRLTAGGSHGNTTTCPDWMLTYEHASTMAPLVGGRNGASIASTSYGGWVTTSFDQTTEANSQFNIMRATVVNNLSVYVSAVTTPSIVLSMGKNGASSSNVTVSLSGTGRLEDLTGSESYAIDDLGNFRVVVTSGSATPNAVQASIDTEAHPWATYATYSATTREYETFAVGATAAARGSTSADDNYTARLGSVTAANLQCYVDVAGTGTRDVTLRLASADSTNLTISVTGTGYFEDVTGSDAVADTDHVGWSLASTGSALGVRWVGLELPWVTTASGALTLQSVPVVSSLDNILIKANAILALQSVPAVSALNNLVVAAPILIPLDTVAAVSSVANVAVAAPVLIAPDTVPVVSNLPNLVVAAPLIIPLDPVAAVSAAANILIKAASYIAPDAVAAVSSAANIDIVSVPTLALSTVAAVSSLSNVTVDTPAPPAGVDGFMLFKVAASEGGR